MQILNGNEIKKEIMQKIENEVALLKKESHIELCLSVILVEGDDASKVYVNNIVRSCGKSGIKCIQKIFPSTVSESELLNTISELNNDKNIHGILCQVPLPKTINETKVLHSISSLKDLDCITPENIGHLTAGKSRFIPCTPHACLQILKQKNIETCGKEVVIIGRSNTVGRPLSILLSQKGWDATVTVCHSKSQDLTAICARADILIGAVGIPKFIKKDFVKKGATIIDVGINWVADANHPKGGELVGDVDYKEMENHASAATPVPGGVGPLTIAMLIFNGINAARLQNNLKTFSLT